MSENNSYFLEIYEPNSDSTVIFSEISDTPFPRFEKGDIIHSLSSTDEYLVVEKVEYIIWSAKKFIIKMMVFTKVKEEWLSSS